MEKNKLLEFLKEVYKMQQFNVNFYGPCIILESYSDEELKKSFLNNDDIAKYLEMFIFECFNAKNINHILQKEKTKIFTIATSQEELDCLKFIFNYYECLEMLASYFEKIKINCKAKECCEKFNKGIEYRSKVIENIRYSDLNFGNSNNKKVFEREKNNLFINNSKNIRKNNEEFFAYIISSIKGCNIAEIDETLREYSSVKLLAANYFLEEDEENLYNLLTYIDLKNNDLSSEFLLNYNLSVRNMKIYNKYFYEIIKQCRSLPHDVYVGMFLFKK